MPDYFDASRCYFESDGRLSLPLLPFVSGSCYYRVIRECGVMLAGSLGRKTPIAPYNSRFSKFKIA